MIKLKQYMHSKHKKQKAVLLLWFFSLKSQWNFNKEENNSIGILCKIVRCYHIYGLQVYELYNCTTCINFSNLQFSSVKLIYTFFQIEKPTPDKYEIVVHIKSCALVCPNCKVNISKISIVSTCTCITKHMWTFVVIIVVIKRRVPQVNIEKTLAYWGENSEI